MGEKEYPLPSIHSRRFGAYHFSNGRSLDMIFV